MVDKQIIGFCVGLFTGTFIGIKTIILISLGYIIFDENLRTEALSKILKISNNEQDKEPFYMKYCRGNV